MLLASNRNFQNMPQNSFRSAVYRSFITCDDPKGVVECKTVRKSKSGSQKMEDKFKYQRIQPKSNTSSEREREDKDSRGSSEDLHNLSSFQVMEVSKEAQKLNEVIDSLSNRASFDKQSKYIANDLLKGALDLQESLVMLGKLQESSRYVAKSKKKQKEKLGGEPRFMDFNRFEEYDQETDFQKPRTSVASSRDCYEELRDVITESFARQKLLPNGTAGGKDLVRNYNLDYCVDAPSSSSSQSSLIHSYSSNSSPSKVRSEKSKGPNLIAKLMGLDEVTSSKPANSIIYEQNKNKMLARHLIDLDLPRPRKPPFQVQTLAGKRRTLEEMIETMQFQGLIGKRRVDRYDDDDDDGDESDVSYSTRSLTVENTPIVIMRPRHVSEYRTKVFHANYYFNKERLMKSREIPRKTRKELPLVAKGSVRSREVHEKLPERRTIKQNLDKEGKISGVSPARPIKKMTVVQDNSSIVKTKHSKPPSPRVQKKETIVKVVDNVEKVALSTRKESDVRASKSRESIKTQNQNEATSLKHNKTGRGSNISKRQIARERTTATDKHMILTTSLKSSTSKKNSREEKADSKPFAALVENIPSDDNLPIDLPIGGTAMKGTISEQIPEEVDLSYNPTYETSGNEASCSGESSEPTIEDGKDTEYESSVSFSDPDKMKGLINTTDTRSLLLSSASFRSRVEELFDTWTSDKYETALPTARSPDCEAIFSFVLLECAKEMLERKSCSCTKTVLSSPSYVSSKPKHPCLDQLVQEILDGIEYLRSYSKRNGGVIVVDNIFPVLERDLWGKTEVTGAWDSGWKNGFSAEEVDEVVNGIQMLVLSDLVDDVVEDFTYW